MLISSPAFAQSSAEQVTPGYLSTSGCSGLNSPCFVPYSASNPMPITMTGGITGGVYLGTSLSAANPLISGDATTGFYTAGAGKVDVTISGVKTAEWSSTGEAITGVLGVSSTFTGPSVNISGNFSASAWTTNGIGLFTTPSTYTDTTSSGTVAKSGVHVISQPTVAANASTTYTEDATFIISGAPSAGTNVTQTRAYSLWLQGAAPSGIKVEGFARFYPPGDITAQNGRIAFGGSGSTTSWTTISDFFVIDASTQTDTSGSGTIAGPRTYVSIGAPTYASSSAVTLTDATNLYVTAPVQGTNTTITNGWGIYSTGGIKVTGSSANSSLDLGSTTTALLLPSGTTGQRPTATNGMARYNSTLAQTEFYIGGAWIPIISPGVVTTPGESLGIGISALSTEDSAGSAAYANTAIGYQAMGVGTMTTAAIQNVAVGNSAFKAVTSGTGNVAVGYNALTADTSGSSNTAVGSQALSTISTGNQGTAVGFASGLATTGINNTYVGYRSARFVSTGTDNVALGYQALLGTTGQALTGSNNTAIGDAALTALQTTAASNTAVGQSAGSSITTGSNITALGASVGSTTLTTGSNIVLIGTSNATTASASGATNEIHIGAGGADIISATGTGTNTTAIPVVHGTVNLPDLAATSAAQTGTVCWATGSGATAGRITVDTTVACLASLEELKDIKQGGIQNALVIINKLDPFWFTWKKTSPEYKGDKYEQPGLGAHQVESVDKRLVGYGPDGKLRGVRYSEMNAILIQALKEEDFKVEMLKDKLGIKTEKKNWFGRTMDYLEGVQ